MNKSQLIEALSKHFEGNKKTAQHALESVLDTITREVARGEKVAITGFGAFEKKLRPVRHPQTGEKSTSESTAVPKFRAGSELRAVVSGQKKLSDSTDDTAAKRPAATKRAAANAATGDDPERKPQRASSTASTTSTSASAAKQQTAKKSPVKQGRATKTSTTAEKSAATQPGKGTSTAARTRSRSNTSRGTTAAEDSGSST